MSETRDDRSDLPFLSRRLTAAYEIAQVETSRSEAHAANSEATQTLGRFNMLGEWGVVNDFERVLYQEMAVLLNQGYHGMHRIARTDEEAKIAITIPAGLTKEAGYVALRRKRKIMTLTSKTEPQLDVDKISMFALDISMLAGLSQDAVREVRLIVAGAMYLAIDHRALGRNDFGISDEHRELFEEKSAERGQTEEAFLRALEHEKLFHEALLRYDMTPGEVQARLVGDEPTRLHDPDSLQFIEDALHTRSELLTPAATTYYAHS